MDPTFESIGTYTPEEFTAFVRAREERGDVHHYELLRGKIIMSPPAGWPHGSIESRLNGPLGMFVRSRGLGEVFGSSQGFRLPSDDIVEPDTAWVSAERLRAANPESQEFLRVVPDLVIEILSSKPARDSIDKREIYESQGVGEYWIVDPVERRIRILVHDGSRFRQHADLASGIAHSAILDGFSIPVADVFP